MSTNNLKILKEKLQNHELEYDHNEWLRLEKDLPVNSKFNALSSKSIITAVVVVAFFIAGIYFINQNDEIESLYYTQKLTEKANIILENQNIKKPLNIKQAEPKEIKSQEYHSHENKAKTEINTNVEKTKTIKESENLTKKEKNNQAEKQITQIDTLKTKSKIRHEDNLKNLSLELLTDGHCSPVKVSFIAQNIPDNYTIIWDTDDNYKIEGLNAVAFYNEEGEYSPKALIAYDGKIVQTYILQNIIVHPTPKAKISFVNNDNIYYFSTQKESDYANIEWKINNESFITSDVRYEFEQSNSFKVYLKVENNYGCKSHSEINLDIVIDQTYYLPNAFIPSSDNLNSNFGPIGENLSFSFYQMTILDNRGRKVFETNKVSEKWNGRLFNSGEKLKGGIYLWEIITIDNFGNSKTKKGRVNLIRK